MKLQQLASAMESLIRQHGSVNRVAVRSGVSREVVTKMRQGFPCRIDVLERFCRNLSLDLDDWRVLCGYAPLPPESAAEKPASPAPLIAPLPVNGEFRPGEYFLSGVRQLAAMVREPIPIAYDDIPSESATREEVDRALGDLGQRVQDARDRRRGHKSGEVEGSEGGGSADNGVWAA